jgi:hypothetical protein
MFKHTPLEEMNCKYIQSVMRGEICPKATDLCGKTILQ